MALMKMRCGNSQKHTTLASDSLQHPAVLRGGIIFLILLKMSKLTTTVKELRSMNMSKYYPYHIIMAKIEKSTRIFKLLYFLLSYSYYFHSVTTARLILHNNLVIGVAENRVNGGIMKNQHIIINFCLQCIWRYLL